MRISDWSSDVCFFRSDTLTVVVGGAYLPSYEGSDDYIASPGALVRGRVAGFSFFTRGASLYVDVLPDHSDSGWDIELGPVANLRLDRNSRIKDPQVRALGKIVTTIELGEIGSATCRISMGK